MQALIDLLHCFRGQVGVYDHGDGKRQSLTVEEADPLLDAILKNREVAIIESRYQTPSTVLDGDRDLHEVDVDPHTVKGANICNHVLGRAGWNLPYSIFPYWPFFLRLALSY